MVVDDHFVVELRMLLKYPSQFIDYARIGILHGIEHAADHFAVGDSPAIGCAEGQAPDLEFLDEVLLEVQGSLLNLCHNTKNIT